MRSSRVYSHNKLSLSLTETRLNEKSVLPSLHRYSFEHVDSTTECGGVEVFIVNHLNYRVRNDLSLNVTDREDLWVELNVEKSIDGKKSNNEKLIYI